MGARKSETSFRKKTKALISLAYYVSELLGKGTIDKKSSGETKGRQGSSSRNFDVLGRELFTPDEVRKLDNKKCIVFIRGFDPIMDNKYIPFAHPMFDQTADGKGEPYVHQTKAETHLIGSTYEILTEKAVKHYEKLKEKGENIYIDTVTYEEFMMLGDVELCRRFSCIEEMEQKNKMNQELQNELEYTDENQNVSNATSGGNSIAARKQVIRKKTEWEDTISNRMLHWQYSKEQKQEVRNAMEAGMTKAEILRYFYPDVSVDQMRMAREER